MPEGNLLLLLLLSLSLQLLLSLLLPFWLSFPKGICCCSRCCAKATLQLLLSLLLPFWLSFPKGICCCSRCCRCSCCCRCFCPSACHSRRESAVVVAFALFWHLASVVTLNKMPRREYHFWVYILSSRSRTLYVGVTNNLRRRRAEHQKGGSLHTSRYQIHRLVYYEHFQYIRSAIARETEIKRWTRQHKIDLIESMNPTWQDLLPKPSED